MLTGFTGHDDEADLGLVNMKGRLYDPTTGRFTTPDPFVQAAGWSQGFNRYSYAWNNPLKWIDPTGFDSDSTGEATSCGPSCFTVPYSGSTDDPLKAGSDAVFGYQFGNLGTGSGVGGAADYSLPTAVSVTTTPGMTSQDFAPNGETSAEGVEDRGIITQMVADDLQRIWAERATPPVAVYQQVQARFILGTAASIPGLSTFALGAGALDSNASTGSRIVSGVGAIFSVAPVFGALRGVGSASGGFLTVYHGTDLASAESILQNGLSVERASQLGGGDVFWATTALSDAKIFAAANPAGGPSAVLQITLSPSLVSTLKAEQLLSIEGSVHQFSADAWGALNESATFARSH